MLSQIQKYWQSLKRKPANEVSIRPQADGKPPKAALLDFDIAPDDPLLGYLLNAQGSIEIDKIELDSSALTTLKNAKVKIIIPLVSQGELVGLLNLGQRRSEQEYSSEDRRLLHTLATQAAPALRVAQLVQEQQAEARERERIEQELKVARVIQQTLLPQEIPTIPGWQIAAYWKPARAVSGDFYDFITFPDGRLGLVVADVTDKGVPAAMMMATSRTILRSTAERLVSPGITLREANNRLRPNTPANMFVTCLYALLDPANGKLIYANAGHPPMYVCGNGEIEELRARGMPLGLMEDMEYEEKEAEFLPDRQLIAYSDGLVEAHDPHEDMFGFPRLRDTLLHKSGNDLIEILIQTLSDFTGPNWEQEDDVTLVTLQRLDSLPPFTDAEMKDNVLYAEFIIQSQPGNELQAVEGVTQAIQFLQLPNATLERLKTAVAETAMNAMEHGNHFRADLPVKISVAREKNELVVRVVDEGGSVDIPEADIPDLDAKLAGLQSPRGWGLFLIKNMVDDMHICTEGIYHTVELIIKLKGEEPK
jgi:serine phosphatase RsbU (regulator of sigma subunit)/anti-sigma regulatory factor (Ser/Thr protein kinase)